jgi:hypothetical protein
MDEAALRRLAGALTSGAPVFTRRAAAAEGEETFALTKAYPVLLFAWPECHAGSGWPSDTVVEDEAGGNPPWLRPATVSCLLCNNNYTCHERCGAAHSTHQRQSLAEYLSAQAARRPFPGAQVAVRSVRDACELHAITPLPFAPLEAVRAYFARCADAVLQGGAGAAQLESLHAQRGLRPPWHGAQPLFGPPLSAAKLTQLAAARYGRALWRTVRLELAEMVQEDAHFGALWLEVRPCIVRRAAVAAC